MNLMPKEKFEALKTRWEHYTAYLDNPKYCDEGIKKVLIEVNKHPGLVTIFSCQGHPKDGKLGRGSLMFGVATEEALQDLYRWYLVLTVRNERPHDFELCAKYKGDVTVKSNGEFGPKQWYPVWTLAWVYSGKETPNVLKTIEEVMVL